MAEIKKTASKDTIDLTQSKAEIKAQIESRKSKLDFFIKNKKDIEAAKAKLK